MFTLKTLTSYLIACICLCAWTNHADANCTRAISVSTSALNVSNKEKRRDHLTDLLIELLNETGKAIGCQFTYMSAPKNRQEALFKNGEVDLLFFATRTKTRDEYGMLIPFFQVKASMISNMKYPSVINNLKKIQEDPSLHVVVLRGYDYGDAYHESLQKPEKENRLSYEPDVFSVARMMSMKPHFVTIMLPTLFEDILKTEKILQNLNGNIRYSNIEEFPWMDIGIYISHSSIAEHDFHYLQHHLTSIAKSERIWAIFQKKYSPDVLKMSIRPLPQAIAD